MQITLELTDTTPFFIRLFSAKEDMKGKIDKEMNKLCILGILRKELSGYSSPAMAIPRQKSDIPRVVADFRYLNTRLPTKHELPSCKRMYSKHWSFTM